MVGRTVERGRMLVEDPTVERLGEEEAREDGERAAALRLGVGVTMPLLLVEGRGWLEVVLGLVETEPLDRLDGRTCGRVVVGLG